MLNDATRVSIAQEQARARAGGPIGLSREAIGLGVTMSLVCGHPTFLLCI